MLQWNLKTCDADRKTECSSSTAQPNTFYCNFLTLKVSILCFKFVSHFSQFHYHLVSSFWLFADKLVSSMQTDGNHCNLLVTKAPCTSLWPVSHQWIPTASSNHFPTGSRIHTFPYNRWLPRAYQLVYRPMWMGLEQSISQQQPATICKQSGNIQCSVATSGCQMVADRSIRLWDWSLWRIVYLHLHMN